MRIRKRVFALAAATFAAAILALPASAFASDDVFELHASDFNSSNNYCYSIEKSGTYKLTENVTGSFAISKGYQSFSGSKVVIDLNGHTLTNDASLTSDNAISVVASDTLDLSLTSSAEDGKIVSTGNRILRLEDLNASMTVSNVSTYTVNMPCFDVDKGELNINSGSFETKNEAGHDAEVLWANTSGDVTVNGGSFALSGVGSNVVKCNDDNITLAGGTFSHLPYKGTLADGTAVYEASDGRFCADSVADARAAVSDVGLAPYALIDAGTLDIAFFRSDSSAQTACGSYGGTKYKVEDHEVVFYADDAESAVYVSQKVHFYDKAVRPAAPGTSESRGFSKWMDGTGAYDFEAPVIDDAKLTPTWGTEPAIAKLNAIGGGSAPADQYFATLQEALNTAADGSMVTLLRDATESVTIKNKAKLTFNLGTKKLTCDDDDTAFSAFCCTGLAIEDGSVELADDGDAALMLCGCSDFSIKGVEVKCGDAQDCIEICMGSSGVIDDCVCDSDECSAVYLWGDSSLTIKDGTYGPNCPDGAVYVDASTLVIEDGSFTSSDNALYADNSSKVTIKGGEFKTTDTDESVVCTYGGKISIDGGSFSSVEGYTMYCRSTEATIAGGTFGSVEPTASADPISLYVVFGTTKVSGGSFEGRISTSEEYDPYITGGSFAILDNVSDIVSGYAMLKHTGEQGKYEVLAESRAQAAANWVVSIPATGAKAAYKVYFESESEAKAFAVANEGSTIEQISHDGNDGDDSSCVAYAKSVDVQLPAIAAGSKLPSTAKAVLVRADNGAAVEVTAQLSWSTLDGTAVEAGTAALGNTPYVVQATVAPSVGPRVEFRAATAATFNGADALGVSVAKDGSLEASYGFTTDAISIGGASIAIPTASYAYTGKRIRPVPVVTLGEDQLAAGIDYTVSYSANKRVGTATATITGAGQYAGTVSKAFKIVPAKVKGVTAKAAGKGKVKVSWAKHKAQTTGFEIRYGTSKAKVKAGKGVKTAKAKGAAKKAVTLKGLKSGKRIYVQVRAYKVVDGKTYRSAWSKVASVKVK